MSKTLVIAECASAHDGEIDKAFRLIDAAVEAGADVCKFQFWSDADALADRRHVPDYYRDIYRRYRMPVDWLPELSLRCAERGIDMAVTCYLPCDVSTIEPYTSRWKVASFEAGALDLRDAISAAHPKPLILSVGMLDDEQAAQAVYAWGRIMPDFAMLSCVSAYPAPIDACNLSVLHDPFDFDGFSDHTANVLTGAFAVCAGAKIVEFHIRNFDTDPRNPDYACALDPGQAKEYVRLIRLAEVMLGDGRKRAQACEADMMRYRATKGQP